MCLEEDEGCNCLLRLSDDMLDWKIQKYTARKSIGFDVQEVRHLQTCCRRRSHQRCDPCRGIANMRHYTLEGQASGSGSVLGLACSHYC
jgi:hypothetical protein